MMSTFQVLLLLLVAAAMFYFMIVTRRSAVQRLFVLSFFVGVTVCVLFPAATTVVAHAIGIGRGADLVLYLSVFFLFVALFQAQLRLKHNEARLTAVVRALAVQMPLQQPVSTTNEAVGGPR
jgi:hypothetical protein